MKPELFFCLAILIGLPTAAGAQAAAPPAPPVTMAAALARQVHLAPNLTVAQAMRSLSDQMGVPIQLASSLAERRLTLQVDHVTARNALNALAELEDWHWKEDSVGRIRVERRPTKAPKEAAYIPRLIQAELPRDLRDYFGLPRPDDDPAKYYWSMVDDQFSPVQASLNKATPMRIEQQGLIVEGHLPALKAGQKVYFAAMTPREQERLVLALVVRGIYRTGARFWRGDLPPYVMDVSSAELELHGNQNLLIGTNMVVGKETIGAGFGASVKR